MLWPGIYVATVYIFQVDKLEVFGKKYVVVHLPPGTASQSGVRHKNLSTVSL